MTRLPIPGSDSGTWAEILNDYLEVLSARVDAVESVLDTKQAASAKGQPSGYADLDVSGIVPNTQLPPGVADRPVVLSFSVPGDLAVGFGLARIYVPTAGTIQSIEAALGVSPDGQSVIVDVNKNGSTLFTTQGNRPTITTSGFTSGVKVPAVTSLAAGDWLTIDVDQVGVQPSTGTVSFISHVSVAQGSASTYNLARPAEAQLGDLLVAKISGASGTTWTAPGGAGWNTIGTTAAYGSQHAQWWWRKDDGAAGPWAFTADVAAAINNRNFILRGQHATTPLDTSSLTVDASGVTSHAIPDITHTATNCLELLGLELSATDTITGLPGDFATIVGFSGSVSAHYASRTVAASGTNTGYTLTGLAGRQAMKARLAIAPAPASGTWTPGEDLTVVIRYLES